MVGYYPSPEATPARRVVIHLLAALVTKPLMEGAFTSVYTVGEPAVHTAGPKLVIPICVYLPDTRAHIGPPLSPRQASLPFPPAAIKIGGM